MSIRPIFIGFTRSFWAFAATVALIADQGEPIVRAIATLVAPMIGGDIDAWTQWGLDVAPIGTLLIAMQQRSGAVRPYTVDPRAL